MYSKYRPDSFTLEHSEGPPSHAAPRKIIPVGGPSGPTGVSLFGAESAQASPVRGKRPFVFGPTQVSSTFAAEPRCEPRAETAQARRPWSSFFRLIMLLLFFCSVRV